MHGNIGTRNVRNRGLVAKPLGFEDQATLLGVRTGAKRAATCIQSKLKGHIQSKQLAFMIRLQPRQIMDAEFGVPDQPHDLLDARLAGIHSLQGDPRIHAQSDHTEKYGPKNGKVGVVERTVDEDVGFKPHALLPLTLVGPAVRLVAISLTDHAILAMNIELNLLFLREFSRVAHRVRLGVKIARCARRTGTAHAPAPSDISNHVSSLGGHVFRSTFCARTNPGRPA